MIKISCNVYQDILPLYVDDVVSPDTKEFMEAHLRECPVCRAELKRMNAEIPVPVDTNANPLRAIKKEWARKNTLIWGMALLLLSCFLLLALPVFDTAMQYHLQGLIGGSIIDLLILIAPLGAIGFGLEWLLVHLKKHRWLASIPLVIPSGILILAEISWASGGWDRIGSGILCAIGFPLLLGAGLAALLKATLCQPRWAKLTAVAVLGAFLVTTVIFWPRYMYNTLPVEPELIMLEVSDNGTQQKYTIEEDDLNREIQFAKMSPCISAPDWDSEDCILVRLNDEYVLAAGNNMDPYVYKFTGALEDFDGSEVCYRVFRYTALYMNLKIAGSIMK